MNALVDLLNNPWVQMICWVAAAAMVLRLMKGAGMCWNLLAAGILLYGVLYTTAPNYGMEKASRFAVLGMIAFVAPLMIGYDSKAIFRILIALFAIGLLLSVGTILAPHAGVIRSGAEQSYYI